MTQLLTAQRRLLLLLSTTLFSILIRIILVPLGGSRPRSDAVVYSDRGKFKQVAFRFTKVQKGSGFVPALKLGFAQTEDSTPYMFRIANFSPFIKIENLGIPSNFHLVSRTTSEESLLYSSEGGCGDGDGFGDGYDGGDGDDGDGDDSIC